MSAAPIVSIVIPLYNSQAYLAEAIDSVLAQTVREIEVLVCDDGSTDNSRAIAETYGPPARLITRDQRGGVSAARNTAIAVASGTWIAFCDADDFWEPDKLERQLDLAATDDRIDLVFTYVHEFISPEIDPATMRTRQPNPLAVGPLPSSMMMRRTLFDRAGEFRVELGRGDFVEWYPRVLDVGATQATVPLPLTHRRLHHSNNSNSTDDGSSYLQAMREHLARRRNTP